MKSLVIVFSLIVGIYSATSAESAYACSYNGYPTFERCYQAVLDQCNSTCPRSNCGFFCDSHASDSCHGDYSCHHNPKVSVYFGCKERYPAYDPSTNREAWEMVEPGGSPSRLSVEIVKKTGEIYPRLHGSESTSDQVSLKNDKMKSAFDGAIQNLAESRDGLCHPKNCYQADLDLSRYLIVGFAETACH